MFNTTHQGTGPRLGTRNHRVIAFVVATMVVAIVAFTACGGGGGGTNVAKFCKDLDASLGAIDQSNGGLAPPGKTELANLSAEMRKLAAEAPAAIKADVNTTAEFFQKASEHGIGSVDGATTSAANDAGERINDFASTNCESQSP